MNSRDQHRIGKGSAGRRVNSDWDKGDLKPEVMKNNKESEEKPETKETKVKC